MKKKKEIEQLFSQISEAIIFGLGESPVESLLIASDPLGDFLKRRNCSKFQRVANKSLCNNESIHGLIAH